jgi:hypothetical protein
MTTLTFRISNLDSLRDTTIGAALAWLLQDQSPAVEFFASFRDTVNRNLPLEPGGKFSQTFFKRNTRLIPKHFARDRYVRKAVPDVTGSVAPNYLRMNVRFAEHAYHSRGDVKHRARVTAANIHHLSRCLARFKCEAASLRHIMDAHEITALAPVLKNHRRIAIQQT